jgi:RNA polymerase sigma-70 factor, ECF subfamily
VTELALPQRLEGELMRPDPAAEERTWVAQVREGDLDAFDAIVLRYEQRLLRFLTGQVGDVEVARDLCQETFVSAYRAMPRMHGEIKLSAWLHTIALNHARSHHRRRRFRVIVPLEDHEPEGHGADLQDTIAVDDVVRRTLGRVPKQYTEPLLLQLVSGLSCREIAGVLGCSEGAVKVRLLRARAAFKKAYEQEVAEPCR